MNTKYTNKEKNELMKKIRALKKRGMSVNEISGIIGVSTNLIYEWLNYGTNPSHPKESDVIALRAKGMSFPEIAKNLGTYPRIIKTILGNVNVNAFANAESVTANPANVFVTNDTETGIMQEVHKDGSAIMRKFIERDENAPALTPDDFIDIFGLDTSRWELVTSKLNTWEGMTSAKKTGVNGKKNLFQASITVRPVKYGTLTYEDIKNFFEENKFIREKEETKIIPATNGYILNITLPDWHEGMRGYDAEKVLRAAIERIIQDAKGKPISKISFVTLGDVMHIDGSDNATTKGTQQQTEKPFDEIFDIAFKSIVWAIDTLSRDLNAPLEYVYVPGNHDRDIGCALAYAIGGRYAHSKNITTDCAPLPFKSRVYGKTLVGYHHGDAPLKNLQTYLINNEKEAFGASNRAIMKVGHLHHYEVNAKGAVPVEYQPSLCPSCDWTAQQGYSSERGMRYTYYSTTSSSYIEGFISVDDIEN